MPRAIKKQSDAGATLGWLIFGSLAAGGIYLVWRRWKETQSDGGSAGFFPSDSSVSTSASMALVARLRASATVRKIYLFQAGLYSWYQTDAVPDGVDGMALGVLVSRVNTALGAPPASVFGDDSLRRLAGALRQMIPAADLAQARVRLVPSSLPADLLSRINSEGVIVAADVPLLQMFPAG
jgi:hypothetical protein